MTTTGGYAEFGRLVLDAVKDEIIEFGGGEIDVEILADLAVRAGLMRHEIYDPSIHGYREDMAKGDLFYEWGDGPESIGESE